MRQKKFAEMTDEELLVEAKKMKSNSIIHAFIIGFMIGIIIYSILVNSIGFLTLIPLYLIFKVFHKPEENSELKSLLKERELK